RRALRLEPDSRRPVPSGDPGRRPDTRQRGGGHREGTSLRGGRERWRGGREGHQGCREGGGVRPAGTWGCRPHVTSVAARPSLAPVVRHQVPAPYWNSPRAHGAARVSKLRRTI